METLNIQCIEQQQVLITLTLTDSNGAPVDLTKYAVYAASVGAVDPYCRRAARLEWAAAINNECSAFIITAPGHDIARAPWKYQICIKNRQLGLEWAVVTGRVELTPRACGTDGTSPAAYTVACEATPSGLVNVTLDATVGSIATTLEQVKASAAAAAAAAQNAHADLEDAETAATKASQAALAAAADAKVASDKATAAEAAATAAPEACAPYVQQTQQAAAAALDASSTAATAAAEAQASADAAATAQGYATRAEEAKTAAVQAAETATTAATTATQQAESATAQAESARLAATTASTASDNAASAATRAEDAATRAEAAAPAADRAESARDAAEAAAATATTAAADVPGLVQRAETAATASEAAKQAAESAQSTAETAASTATAQAEAAAASATQADTDARACSLFVPRAEAAQQAAAASATAAADSATSAAASAASVVVNQTHDGTSANAESGAVIQGLIDDEELRQLVSRAYGIYAVISATDQRTTDNIKTGLRKDGTYDILISYKNEKEKAETAIRTNDVPTNDGWARIAGNCRVLIAPNVTGNYLYNEAGIIMNQTKSCYVDFRSIVKATKSVAFGVVKLYCSYGSFDKLEIGNGAFSVYFGTSLDDNIKLPVLSDAKECFKECYKLVRLNSYITFSEIINGEKMFYACSSLEELPVNSTFEKLENGIYMLYKCSSLASLPEKMTLSALKNGANMFNGCYSLPVQDLARVLYTLQDLTALETPSSSVITLPVNCMHDGSKTTTSQIMGELYPDLLIALNSKGWTVNFA